MTRSTIKNLLFSNITFALMLISNNAQAALASNAILLFESGIYAPCPFGGTPPNCNFDANIVASGSFFELDGFQVAMVRNEGVRLGELQSTTTHSIPPFTLNVSIDNLWTLPGLGTDPIGAHATVNNPNGAPANPMPVSIFSDDMSGNALLNMEGWGFVFAEVPFVPLGSGTWDGNPEGKAELTCDNDCGIGDSFGLHYSATILPGDPSGLGQLEYRIYLEGEIGSASVVPVPAAVWLFSSGLLGLLAVARKRTLYKSTV